MSGWRGIKVETLYAALSDIKYKKQLASAKEELDKSKLYKCLDLIEKIDKINKYRKKWPKSFSRKEIIIAYIHKFVGIIRLKLHLLFTGYRICKCLGCEKLLYGHKKYGQVTCSYECETKVDFEK